MVEFILAVMPELRYRCVPAYENRRAQSSDDIVVGRIKSPKATPIRQMRR
ncbi:hypothetical protein RMSM_07258 [Rhodopirellula maiorica SM1]|uniref:Uncharacterized protein n=1 Tax=Rhodopirellula maiorica SM1 TaxID=1265738 RepID=M5RKD8_9BACT|nr:hypothetical protein RMSM_07258 [Rhodopirellula maiorica SM1]